MSEELKRHFRNVEKAEKDSLRKFRRVRPTMVMDADMRSTDTSSNNDGSGDEEDNKDDKKSKADEAKGARS